MRKYLHGYVGWLLDLYVLLVVVGQDVVEGMCDQESIPGVLCMAHTQ